MVSNCGQNEWGGIYNGKPGDQTSKEWCIIPWYSYPWDCVMRWPDRDVAADIAAVSRAAALNNNVGYDQITRGGFYTYLKAAGWDASKIATACNTDCSASTCACVVAAGYRKGVPALQKINPSLTTYKMREAFRAAGFQILTDRKYTHSPDLLLAGDILLSDENHVCINLDDGKSAPAPAKGKWIRPWMYQNPDGSLKKNVWWNDGKDWYWFKPDGRCAQSEWVQYKGAWYWLKDDCRMAKSQWAHDGKGWAYFDKDGRALHDQWLKYNNAWYYLKSNCYMATNQYVNDSHGKCWVGADGKWDGKYY